MRLLSYQGTDSHNIYLLGDLHFGTKLFHEKGFIETVKTINDDKSAAVFLMGDLIEAIMVDDPRYQFDTADPRMPTPMVQAKAVVQLLEPIAGKVKGILDGNHEGKLHRFGNLGEFVANSLDVPYGTYSSRVSVRDKENKLMFKMFLAHGWGSINSAADDEIRRDANMILSLKRKLKKKAGDCILMAMGHTHKLLVSPPKKTLYLTDDGRRIKQNYTTSKHTDSDIHPDHRWYCNTGSFYRLYGDDGVSGYAERFGYDPVELGYIKITVKDRMIADVEPVTL